MDSKWSFELLGWIRAHRDGQVVSRFRTRHAALLLAYLLLSPDRSHSRDDVALLLWPGSETSTARTRLRQAIASLRRQFESPDDKLTLFKCDRSSITILSQAFEVDVLNFEHLCSEARNASSKVKIQKYEQAIELLRGEFLPGFYEEWVLERRQRITDLHIEALEKLGALYEEAKQLQKAIDHTRTLVGLSPLSEDYHVRLMRLYNAVGQSSMVLNQYKELKTILKDSLGEEPSFSTRILVKDLLENRIVLVNDDHVPAVQVKERNTEHADPKTQAKTRHRIKVPTPLTKFFGRETEMQEIKEILENRRSSILTLTGLGGCGKTRLATEAAHAYNESFDGLWFISLAEFDSARSIPSAILQALEAKAGNSKMLETIKDVLSTYERPLLILDNMEHIVDEGAKLVQTLHEMLPSLVMIVTSRQKLNIDGEIEVQVNTLQVPGEEAEESHLLNFASVQLFCDRAKASRLDFEPLPESRKTLLKLCRKLEGIPLSIELAASWSKYMTIEDMLKQFTNRFELLVSRRKDVSPRHRSLWAAIDYSYTLLPPELQKPFAQLSVFRGSWTAAAAKKVCCNENMSKILEELHDRSLLMVDTVRDEGQEPRYYMLETVAVFANERLTKDEIQELNGRHAHYFAEKVSEDAKHYSKSEVLTVQHFLREYANIRKSLSYLREIEDAETGLQMSIALHGLWEAKGPYSEGRDWISSFLTIAPNSIPQALRASALARQGFLASLEGDIPTAKKYQEQALGIYEKLGDNKGIVETMYEMGFTASREHDHNQLQDLCERCLQLIPEEDTMRGKFILYLAYIAFEQNRLDSCEVLAWQAHSYMHKLGNLERESQTLYMVGAVALMREQYVLSKKYFIEALELADQCDSDTCRQRALSGLSEVAVFSQNYEEAYEYLYRSVQLHLKLGDKFWLRGKLITLARYEAEAGILPRAAILLELCEDLTTSCAAPMPPVTRNEFEYVKAFVEERLGKQEFKAASKAAKRTSIQEILSEIFATPKSLAS